MFLSLLWLPEIGNFLLMFALFVAFGVGVLPFVKKIPPAPPFAKGGIKVSRQWTFFLFALIVVAYGILTFSFLNDDFSVWYVASNSSRALPWWYKACAVWGGHEGSILLWVLILSGWMAAVALLSKTLPDVMTVRVLSILAWITVGFLLFILLTSNPFMRLLPNIPANGRDLNPLLQDIGFLMHPPVLYMGYVGFSVPFALTLAALWTGEWQSKWAAWSRPWTLAAWCFLTIGITLGSWWAYRELGWGGWWFWDPVENASFMPWIVGTALVHSLIVTEKKNTFKGWTTLLAILAFSLSLLGTFLVRSGILTSVHSFAVDPSRGLAMLIFLWIVLGVALTLYAWRAMVWQSNNTFSLISRETGLMLNNVMLVAIMLVILLGTLYPLVIQVLNLGQLSVGAPYFNTMFSLLMMPVLFLMGLGPATYWQNMAMVDLIDRTRLAFLLSLVAGLLLPWLLWGTFYPWTALGLFLAVWIMSMTIASHWRKRHWGMFFAHMGIAVTLAGIVVSSSYSIERHVIASVGDRIALGQYTVIFKQTHAIEGPNYSGMQAVFLIEKDGEKIAIIKPEKHYYPIQKTVMTDAAIYANVFRDIYVVLGEGMEKKGRQVWVVRLYDKPLVRWIWAGGFFILLGGSFACVSRFRRLLRR